MNKLKPLPIGIQTFRKIKENQFLYIDKTQYLYNLITSSSVYFLSRPRRFGKSLLISTLKEIFEGNKELFQDLWIYNSDYEWKPYPVIRMDFSQMQANSSEELRLLIISSLNDIAHNYDITLENRTYTTRFKELLVKLSEHNAEKKVVILIDEYDSPIIQHITDIEKAKEMREIMKGFYTIIKSMDEVIRFVFLTGVSKFSKAGIFSGLNNLQDLTMRSEYSAMLGFTEEEITQNLSDYLENFALTEKTSVNNVLKQLRDWYNGYSFSKKTNSVYNPFSTFNALSNKEFENYWFETGTPTFLINLIKEKQFAISDIPVEVKELSFSNYEIEQLDILPLLFQTGYLTIKSYNKETRYYKLDYPNFEVKESFLESLLKSTTHINGQQDVYIEKLVQSLQHNDIVLFFEILSHLFYNIPYDIQIKNEKYYQSIFYLIFMIVGFRIEVEVKTDIGRIDAVVETDKIYIFEFKLRGSKEEALQQIKNKKYYQKYESKNKPIVLIGVKFNPKAEEDYFEWIREDL